MSDSSEIGGIPSWRFWVGFEETLLRVGRQIIWLDGMARGEAPRERIRESEKAS